MVKKTKVKKNLIIVQTKTHTETIYTEDPKGEVNRLIRLHHNDLQSIILNDKVIYIKNEK